MPIYEYQCENCGKIREAIQKMSDPLLTDCNECGQATLKKLVSRTSFQLKGSGWYVTDFRDSNKESKSGVDKPAVANDSTDKTSATTDKGEAKSAKSEKTEKTEKSDKPGNGGDKSTDSSKNTSTTTVTTTT